MGAIISFENTVDGNLELMRQHYINNVSHPFGTGRMTEWKFADGETKGIDEGDIDPTTDNDLFNAVADGKLSITSDLDDIESERVRNFLAKALGAEYKKAGENLTANHVAKLDATSSIAAKVASNGDQPYGVVEETVTSGNPVRLKTKMYSTATCVASGTITVGDKVIARTDGKVQTSTTKGLWQVGTALESKTNGQNISIKIEIKQIA